MTWFADLSPCNYHGEAAAGKLRAVGWLSYDHPFPTGSVPPDVFDRLRRLLIFPFPFGGTIGHHSCDLCYSARLRAQGEAIEKARFPDPRIGLPQTVPRYTTRSSQMLFVPGEHEIYACPELILHYIADHRYSPPEEFRRAVLDCPRIPSVRYFHRLLDIGGREWVSVIEQHAGCWPALVERLRTQGHRPRREARIAMRALRMWRAP